MLLHPSALQCVARHAANTSRRCMCTASAASRTGTSNAYVTADVHDHRRLSSAAAPKVQPSGSSSSRLHVPEDECIAGLASVAAASNSTASGTAAGGTSPKPAEMDAQRFELDPSVHTWANYGSAQGTSPLTGVSGQGGTTKVSAQQLLAHVTSSGLVTDAQSGAYWAYHTARFAFFAAQAAAGLMAHHAYESATRVSLSGLLSAATGRASSSSSSGGSGSSGGPTPLQRLGARGGTELASRLAEAVGTWKQDYAWIREGRYKLPWDMTTAVHKQYNPIFALNRTLTFLGEATHTLKRRVRNESEDLWVNSNMYPEYYTKSFHYQSDGWFSDRSAEIYEHSTETLFLGRQDAMQRAALVPISQYVSASGRDVRSMRLLEVACGTGRFHTFIKDNYPELPSVASDLSPYYLIKARDNMTYWKGLRQPRKSLGGFQDTGVEFVQAAAERLGAPDASFDIVVCVYLFHELPASARQAAAAEMFRVLKPGGLCVLTDSVQLGDRPEWDATLGNFELHNEPYYRSYIEADLGALFEAAGFACDTKYVSSATKVLSFTKPHEAPAAEAGAGAGAAAAAPPAGPGAAA